MDDQVRNEILSLIREVLTVRVETQKVIYSSDVTVKVAILLDGESIAESIDTIDMDVS